MGSLRTAVSALREEIRLGDSAPEPDPAPPRKTEKDEAGWLPILGYVAAVLFPIAGIVLAIPLVVRAEYRHAAGVLLAVVASFLLRLALLSGGGY